MNKAYPIKSVKGGFQIKVPLFKGYLGGSGVDYFRDLDGGIFCRENVVRQAGYLLGLLSSSLITFAPLSAYCSETSQAPNGFLVQNVNDRSTCPADFETLIEQLLKDLPSYANRAIQRSRSTIPSQRTSVILAGRPEFEPLPLAPDQPIPEDPRQVFITTLEQGYFRGKAFELQQYHWVFLTKTETGWRLALMFTRTGGSPEGRTPSPPRESSQSAIAQAIRFWLRDCQARSR